jgi:cellulase
VTVEMHQHASRACTEEAIGGAHRGPTIVYMAAVTDATTADPTAAKWFKVFEEGYDAATKEWSDASLPPHTCSSPARPRLTQLV